MTFTLIQAKAQAKALRRALQAQGISISHSQTLEAVASQHGMKDWNTLCARLIRRELMPTGGARAGARALLGPAVQRAGGGACRGHSVLAEWSSGSICGHHP